MSTPNKEPSDEPALTTSRTPTRVTTQYRRLLAKLRQDFVDENGKDHGWINAAAKKLGRSAAYIGQINSGQKGVALRTAEVAALRLSIPIDWFFGTEAAWSLSESGDADPPESQVVSTFLARFGGQYSPFTVHALELLASNEKVSSTGAVLDLADSIEAALRSFRRAERNT